MTDNDEQPHVRFIANAPTPNVQYDKSKNTSAYKKAHKQLRARLIAQLPTPCIRCGRIIPAGIDSKLIHLDHYVTAARDGGLAGEGALAHRRCNEADGAAFTNSRRRKPDRSRNENNEQGESENSADAGDRPHSFDTPLGSPAL